MQNQSWMDNPLKRRIVLSTFLWLFAVIGGSMAVSNSFSKNPFHKGNIIFFVALGFVTLNYLHSFYLYRKRLKLNVHRKEDI